jgi:hypothetical protein
MPTVNPSLLLKKNDQELFSAGACHIFARELIDHFKEMDYDFCCMESEQWVHHINSGEKKFSPRRLVHVYARSGNLMIDIRGVRTEQEYLEEFISKNLANSGPNTYFCKVYTRACDLEELFKPKIFDPEKGWMNKDRLYLDDAFVSEAKDRATKVIQSNPSIYSVTNAMPDK